MADPNKPILDRVSIQELEAKSEEQIKQLFNSVVGTLSNEFTKQLNAIYTVVAHLNKENFILREIEAHLRADTINPELRDSLLERLNTWRMAVIKATTTETVQVDPEPKTEGI